MSKSESADALLVDEFPVALVCRLLKVTEGDNIIGQIINVSADLRVLGADGKIDAAKLQAISFIPRPMGDCIGAYRVIEELYETGKIRAIGIYPHVLADICETVKAPLPSTRWKGKHGIFTHPVLTEIGKKYSKTAAQGPCLCQAAPQYENS